MIVVIRGSRKNKKRKSIIELDLFRQARFNPSINQICFKGIWSITFVCHCDIKIYNVHNNVFQKISLQKLYTSADCTEILKITFNEAPYRAGNEI